MSNYRFRVYGIEWNSSKLALPSEAFVMLSKYLVEADSINDDEWDEAINDGLEAQFCCRATGFGFEPADVDEEDDGDEEDGSDDDREGDDDD